MKNTRSKYDKEFKLMAVELLNTGMTSTDVGRELGIGHDSAQKWKHQLSSEGITSFPGNGKRSLTVEQREIIELKRKLRDSELERDILKKAVRIFSKGDGESSSL